MCNWYTSLIIILHHWEVYNNMAMELWRWNWNLQQQYQLWKFNSSHTVWTITNPVDVNPGPIAAFTQ